ncbi:MAG: 30S ribosomal protein S20 [Planctomycetes bacterium]|nr:30S ribosomal protein S20 [Planctomycetota bacterium]
MPTTTSAKKRHRQNRVRRTRNRAVRSLLKTQVKRVLAAVESKDVGASEAEFKTAGIKLDRSAARGVLHANKAARLKSRLQKKIKALKGK